jgi:hypothetical protein
MAEAKSASERKKSFNIESASLQDAQEYLELFYYMSIKGLENPRLKFEIEGPLLSDDEFDKIISVMVKFKEMRPYHETLIEMKETAEIEDSVRVVQQQVNDLTELQQGATPDKFQKCQVKIEKLTKKISKKQRRPKQRRTRFLSLSRTQRTRSN